MSGPEKVGELYLELELRAKQLDQQADKVEGKLDDIAQAGKRAKGGADEASEGLDGVTGAAGRLAARAPGVGVVVAAIGAALVIVAKNAVDASESLDTATKSLTAAAPRLSQSVAGLRDALTNIATATGRTVDELGKVGASSARAATSVDDFATRLKLASDLARATGTEFEGTADGVNQIVAAFELTGEQVGPVTDELFRLAQAGVPLKDLFRALQSATPVIQETGLSFEAAARGLASFLLKGKSPAQAAQELKDMAKEGTATEEALRGIAAAAIPASDNVKTLAGAMDDLEDATDRVNKANERTKKNLVPLGDAMRRLGGEIKAAAAEFVALASTPGFARYLQAGNRGGAPNPLATALPIIVTPSTQQLGSAAAPDAPIRNTGVAAREATRSLSDLQKILDGLKDDVFPGLVDEVKRAREEINALAKAAGGQEAENLRVYANQLLTVQAALKDFNPIVVRPQADGFVLGLRQGDIDSITGSLTKLNQEAKKLDETLYADADRQALASLRDTQQQAAAIQQAVQGALDLADAFGIVDDELADVLASLAQVAVNIGPLVEALSTPGAGLGTILTSALPVLGGLGSLIGGLSNLLGESPALTAAKVAIQRNTVALDKLREEGLFNTNRAGGTFNDVGSRIDAVTSQDFAGGTSFGNKGVRAAQVRIALEEAGLTVEELQRLAGELNLTLPELSALTVDQFLAGLEQLKAGLGDADITGFADTFQGQLTKLKLGFEVFGTGATDQFAQFVELLTGPNGATGLFDGLQGIDLSSADGIAEARTFLENLFTSFEGLEKEDLGGLNPQEFINAILTLLGLLPTLGDEAEGVGDAVKTAAEQFRDGVDAINRAVRVFDLSPLEQAELFFAEIGKFSTDLSEGLAGFDLASAEGLAAAITFLQDYYSQIEDGTISLADAAFTIDDLVAGIDLLQGVAADAAREAERLAEVERRAAEQSQRDAENAVREYQRRIDEEQRAAERAHQEELRRIEEIRRARLDVGSDTLRALQEQFQLFDVDDIAEQLQQRLTVLASQSPVFAGLGGGINANDAGSRAELLARLREFALTNPFGQESGNLSADAVRSEVLSLAELIKALNEVALTTDEQRNESFRIDRSITQDEGARISGLLGTGNILAEESLAVQRAMLSLWQDVTGFTGLSAPAVQPALGGFGSSTIVLTVNINGTEVAGGLSAAGLQSVKAFGQAIANELLIGEIGG